MEESENDISKYAQIKELIKETGLKGAIETLKSNDEFNSDKRVSRIIARFKNLDNQILKGIISSEEARLETNRITDSLLSLVEENDTEQINNIRSKRITNYILILISLFLLILLFLDKCASNKLSNNDSPKNSKVVSELINQPKNSKIKIDSTSQEIKDSVVQKAPLINEIKSEKKEKPTKVTFDKKENPEINESILLEISFLHDEGYEPDYSKLVKWIDIHDRSLDSVGISIKKIQELKAPIKNRYSDIKKFIQEIDWGSRKDQLRCVVIIAGLYHNTKEDDDKIINEIVSYSSQKGIRFIIVEASNFINDNDKSNLFRLTDGLNASDKGIFITSKKINLETDLNEILGIEIKRIITLHEIMSRN